MNKGTPTVTEMQVIPVAGYDSMLMTLSGCHAPYFTRNLVILKDSAGHTGIGEIHGGDYTCDALKSCIPLVVGQPVGKYRAILDSIHKASTRAKEDDGEGIQSLDISKLKFVVKAEWEVPPLREHQRQRTESGGCGSVRPGHRKVYERRADGAAEGQRHAL